MDKLAEYKKRYRKAMKATPSKRDFLLAEIMTDMEREFRIPTLRLVAEREVAPEVLRLYCLVSYSRSI